MGRVNRKVGFDSLTSITGCIDLSHRIVKECVFHSSYPRKSPLDGIDNHNNRQDKLTSSTLFRGPRRPRDTFDRVDLYAINPRVYVRKQGSKEGRKQDKMEGIVLEV